MYSQIQWLPGDITGDGTLDVLDIIQEVSIILEVVNPEPGSRELWAADMNWDGMVDILDVIEMVNVIIQPLDCEEAQVCSDSPFECCTPLHFSAFMACGDCHQNIYDNTDQPNHSIQEFPVSYCSTCHNPVLGWDLPVWEHRYADIGCIQCHQPAENHLEFHGHNDNDCRNCHIDIDLIAPPECSDCHGQ